MQWEAEEGNTCAYIYLKHLNHNTKYGLAMSYNDFIAYLFFDHPIKNLFFFFFYNLQLIRDLRLKKIFFSSNVLYDVGLLIVDSYSFIKISQNILR